MPAPQGKRRKTSSPPPSSFMSPVPHRTNFVGNSIDSSEDEHPHEQQHNALDTNPFPPDCFHKIPIEIRQHIASFLNNDDDLESFRRVCQATYSAIDEDNLSFWQRRFLNHFDKPLLQASNTIYKQMYKQRQRYLTRPPTFKYGLRDDEKACLEHLKTIILDSFSDTTTKSRSGSLNIEYLVQFAENTDSLLQEIFMFHGDFRPPEANELLSTIRVLLAPLILWVHVRDLPVYDFPQSQRYAYDCADVSPVFRGPRVLAIDMTWALHQLNFWRFHLTRRIEFTLYYDFADLEDSEKPSFWRQSLFKPSAASNPICRAWKGCYSYVHLPDLKKIRTGNEDEGMIQDIFNGEQSENNFQDLILELNDQGEDKWPARFEQCLRSLELPEEFNSLGKTRAQLRSADSESLPTDPPRNFRFGGTIVDGTKKFCADGWLNSLPLQSGIPGFQRLTMMKYRCDEHGVIKPKSMWAYEGAVLPGGRIVVGRWWCPQSGTGEDQYSGPFILWSVDSKKGPSDA